jgi:hypothetical protein
MKATITDHDAARNTLDAVGHLRFARTTGGCITIHRSQTLNTIRPSKVAH